MKKLSCLILLVICLMGSSYSVVPVSNTVGQGKQPQVSVDGKGIVRIVYGSGDKIFCATSTNNGQTFSAPVLVAQVADMHLGMSRGPQLASSRHTSVITVIDKAGNIHWFKLINGSEKWQAMGTINDLKGSAPEGMIAINADAKENFYTVWLDTRVGGKNQLWFASLSATSNKWSTNRMIYQSPDEHICECCKPSIAVAGTTVAVMFRNWLNGSRDLYVLRSDNSGRSFAPAQKMGLDTWKLNGCPMDGGGIRINSSNQVQTVWQRKGDIYFAQGREPEIYIAKGKICSLTGNAGQAMITYQNNDTLKLVNIPDKKTTIIGEGSFMKSVRSANKSIIFVWEQGDQIRYRSL